MAEKTARFRHLVTQEAFWDLFVASFVALFFEALLIRWLPTSIYYLGYFKNCILIATFLGFGIGCATRLRAERVLPAFTLLCAAVVLGVLLSENHLTIVPWQTGEFLWEHAGRGTVTVSMHLFLIVAFVIAALLMIPLGRQVGMHLGRYPPLVAYSINLIASVLGVSAFLLVSFLQLGPDVWFALGLLPLLYSFRRHPRAAFGTLVGVLLIIGMIRYSGSADAIWSPYHKITLQEEAHPEVNARMLMTNNMGHQVLYDLSAERLERRPEGEDRLWKLVVDHVAIYESAYEIHRPRSVLIVGGGTGNEAAAALRRGAQKIDVVEIDPAIIDVGTRLHPERPYEDARVSVINDDARHHMATTDERYDLIIFGFLDSTSHLSSLSNIRLDNYVYTLESFRRARDLLNPGGLLQVTYYAVAPFVRARIYLMLLEVFERPPLIFKILDGLDDYIYFSGPAVAGRSTAQVSGMTQMAVLESPEIDLLPVDDWPFMNLPARRVGNDYLIALAMMTGLSIIAIGVFLGVRASGGTSRGRFTILFLLGVAFMLLETCTITRMALILGSTWIVTQTAVIVVLLASLVASQLILRYRLPTIAHGFGLLLIGAMLNFLIPMDAYQTFGSFRVLAAAGAVYLPILGSSVVFGRVFADSPRSDAELGVNILGAVFGGVAEYVSLMAGIRSIYLIVVAIFVLVGLILLTAQKSDPGRLGMSRHPVGG